MVSSLKIFPLHSATKYQGTFAFNLDEVTELNLPFCLKQLNPEAKPKPEKMAFKILSSRQQRLLILRDEKQMRWALQFVHVCCLQRVSRQQNRQGKPQGSLMDYQTWEDRLEIPQRIRQLDFSLLKNSEYWIHSFRILEGGGELHRDGTLKINRVSINHLAEYQLLHMHGETTWVGKNTWKI